MARKSMLSKKRSISFNVTSFCSTSLVLFIPFHLIPVDWAQTLVRGLLKFTHAEGHVCVMSPTVPSEIESFS